MHSKDAALEAARSFITLMRQGGLRISQAFMFGSYASGKPSEDSDIDVAVVSPDFTGFRFDDLGRIARFKIQACTDIEVHPFAEQDFTQDNPFAQLVKQSGLKIA